MADGIIVAGMNESGALKKRVGVCCENDAFEKFETVVVQWWYSCRCCRQTLLMMKVQLFIKGARCSVN